MANQGRILNMFLLGKTGNGKSSTGNSILGREAFKGSNSPMSVTKVCTLECSERDGTTIRIVDSPGLMDTKDPTESTLSEIGQAMSLCPGGFDAIIFVIKFGNRFTDEEQKVFDILKQYFGQDIIQKFGIIVMSQGDSFYMQNNKKLTFKEWLANMQSIDRESTFSKLLTECNNRCVLFYNCGEMFEKLQQECVSELLELIHREIPKPYTSYHFQNAKSEREKLIKDLRAPALCVEIQEKLSLLVDQLQKDMKNNVVSFDNMALRFKGLENELDKLNDDSKEFKEFKLQIQLQQENLKLMKNSEDTKIQKAQQEKMMRDLEALKNPPSIIKLFSTGFLAGLSTVAKVAGTAVTFGFAHSPLKGLEDKAYEMFDSEIQKITPKHN